VRPEHLETAIRFLLDQGLRITRIEPKRARLEELFTDLAGGRR
jgi:hypothetical protein